MGLDVYLYRCKDPKALTAYEKVRDDAHEEIYQAVLTELKTKDLGEYNSPGWKEYDKRKKAWDKANPAPTTEKEINQNSEKHPEHMFKIGYFRSSYNDSGTNAILRSATGKDLYYIFGEDADKREYRFVPNWQQALERAKEVLSEYRAELDRVGAVKVIDIGPNPFAGTEGLPADKEAVMKVFAAEQDRHNEQFAEGQPAHPFSTKDMNWYSSSNGHFFLGKGASLLAAIPGKSYGGRTTTYAVIRDGESSEDNYYLTALEVVVETCEYVLRHKNPQEFCLHWSS